MPGTDDGIDMHNGHDPVPIVIIVWFKDPQAVVWVGICETLAEFVNECTFERLLPERERKK